VISHRRIRDDLLLWAAAALISNAVTPMSAQTARLPLVESFDSLSPPALPRGWLTSVRRSPGGDFVTASTGAASPPTAVVGSNSTIEQWIALPSIEWRDWKDLSIGWRERRSPSHNSTLIAEVAAGTGQPYVPLPGGSFTSPESTGYVDRLVPLPGPSPDDVGLDIRLRVAGDGTGATGTIRLDDVEVTGTPRRDLSITVVPDSAPLPSAGGTVRIRCLILNAGFEASGPATVGCFLRDPAVGDPSSWEPCGTSDVGPLEPAVSALVDFPVARRGSGPVDILCVCLSQPDMVPSNDSAVVSLWFPPLPHAVVINEIMYDPPPGRAEYVELLNVTTAEVDLGSWRLTDRDDDTTVGRFGTGPIPVGPGEYVVCSPDTDVRGGYPGIPPWTRVIGGLRGLSLNNGGDRLLLVDRRGGVVDGLGYLPSWHTPVVEDPSGRSLEKIDPLSPGDEGWNWGSCPDPSGGTPGRANRLNTAATEGRTGGVACDPNPFSPDGDGFEDATNISFDAGPGGGVVRVRIFDSDGIPVRTLTRSVLVAGRVSVVWNGYDDGGLKAGIGIYIVLVEGIDASGAEAFTAKGVVVLAGRL
jgi:hypothetical protein